MKSGRVKIQHNRILHKHSGLSQEHESRLREYYWIWAESDHTGRQCVYGYKNSYEEAQRFANGIHNAHCQITPLRTKDESTATRMLRAIVLGNTGDIDESFQRFKHKHQEI